MGPALEDLSRLKADRESFKAAVAPAYPEKKPNAVAGSVGQLFRFIHEMKPVDLIAYWSKVDRQIHMACVEGPYFHSVEHQPTYPHRRKVKWLKTIPRTGSTREAGGSIKPCHSPHFQGEHGGMQAFSSSRSDGCM